MSQKGDLDSSPICIGIILDGNRRWAKERGLPTLEGHRQGMKNIEPIVLHARDKKIHNVVVYAFSTENWQRSEEEVSYLMNLVVEGAEAELAKLSKERVRIVFVGERERLPKKVQDAMRALESGSPAIFETTLWVCLSYGGRADIVQAAQKLADTRTPITQENLREHLWTAGMPDPDVIIRTGGEKRLSNFLPWEATYAELFFPNVFWPVFTPADLDSILEEYALRERRRGK